jgi:hypothetical protein
VIVETVAVVVVATLPSPKLAKELLPKKPAIHVPATVVDTVETAAVAPYSIVEPTAPTLVNPLAKI